MLFYMLYFILYFDYTTDTVTCHAGVNLSVGIMETGRSHCHVIPSYSSDGTLVKSAPNQKYIIQILCIFYLVYT